MGYARTDNKHVWACDSRAVHVHERDILVITPAAILLADLSFVTSHPLRLLMAVVAFSDDRVIG